MNFQPYVVARYGIYVALAVAGLSVWLGQQAGATLDFTIMRGVFVFVVFTAIGFAAEAVLTIGIHPTTQDPTPAEPRGAQTDE